MNTMRSLIVLAAGAFAGSAQAVTTSYTFATGTTALSSGIANSSGVAFQNSVNPSFAGPGVVAWGYFTITDAEITGAQAPATLVSAFQNWNTLGTNTFAQPGPGATSNRGTFTFNPAARDLGVAGPAGGAEFASKNMYVFVGNGTTFAGSSEFLVLKTDFIFDTAESGVSLFAKTITTTNSDVILGTQVANVFTTGADVSQTPGWQTVVLVPEPSSAILGAIGALGLLRRRRN